jgi:hypothetical protein
VEIWTNHGKRGCNNPTKTSTPLPRILVFPYSILLKHGVMVSVNFPIREKFWPLHRIETVIVEIWTNNRKRGCNNPTKTSTPLPSILVLPYSILLKHGVLGFC